MGPPGAAGAAPAAWLAAAAPPQPPPVAATAVGGSGAGGGTVGMDAVLTTRFAARLAQWASEARGVKAAVGVHTRWLHDLGRRMAASSLVPGAAAPQRRTAGPVPASKAPAVGPGREARVSLPQTVAEEGDASTE